LEVSVIGRVNNITLPVAKALLPVFEAIINSIQACSSRTSCDIELQILRDLSQSSLSDEANFLPEITSFIIKDNGCGFITENFKSFNKSDSISKAEIGGKGIGRFLWLKAFEFVKVNSVFEENNKKKNISFEFSAKKEGIAELKKTDVARSVPPNTEIELVNIIEKYRKYIPRETKTISQDLFEYCLPYFINGQQLNISVYDNYNAEKYNLLEMYNNDVKNSIKKKQLKIAQNELDVFLINYPTTAEASHRIIYCANNREVKIEKLSKYIPMLSHRLKNEPGGEFILVIYVLGKYLDEMVNQERTQFLFNDEEDEEVTKYGQQEMMVDNLLTLSQIRQAVLQIIEMHIEPNIKELKASHLRKIEKIINENSPEYKSVLTYCKEDIYNIPPTLSTENTELELYKIRHKLELDIRQRNNKLLEKEPSTDKEMDEFIKEYRKMAEELTIIGKDKLTDYILQRRAIIKLFEIRLKKRDDDKYPLEKAIHNIIVPLRTTSDEIDYMNQNLWLIDERFTYHYYLSSDENIKKSGKKGETKRPDILFFNKSLVFTEDQSPYQSIVIIEFKRPQRNDYTDSDNPFTQVLGYMDMILENKATDKDGRPIIVGKSSRFYVYIICDITPKIDKLAKNYSATKSPDNMGYFWFNSSYNAYM
jgi:hypothetical protein